MRPSATEGWRLVVLQVTVQLRQHHQGQELEDGFRRLDQTFQFLGVVIEKGEDLLVGMCNGKRIAFADQALKVSVH